MKNKSKLSKASKFNLATSLIVLTILVVLGVAWMVLTSIKNPWANMIGTIFTVLGIIYLVACFTIIVITLVIANMEDDEDGCI